MTTTLRVNLRDLSLQFFKELEEKAGASAQVEIRIESSQHGEGLFTEEQFWHLIELFDWKQKDRTDIIQPAVSALSNMPISAIYLFEDFLSKQLFDLDTRAHAEAYMNQQDDDYFSVDDFLYARCAVVAEGKEYFEKIKRNPSELSSEIDFEHLLSVAADAYKQKTGRDFEYSPLYNYETKSITYEIRRYKKRRCLSEDIWQQEEN
jgi:Protein of unknown function (DUF4240)